MSRYLLLLLAISILFACKSSEKRLKTSPRISAETLNSSISEIEFDWLQSKIKANLGEGQPIQNLNVTLRIRKDSAIWMSISAFLGIEVARILITQDSIKILDRLNKRYKVYTFQFINTISYIELDFQKLQGLLVGNRIFHSSKNLKLKTEENYYVLSSFENGIRTALWLSPEDYLLQQMEVTQEQSTQQIKVTYAAYQKVGEIDFSHLRDITLGGENAIHTVLTYSKVKLNVPLKFPFSIPKDYEGT